MTTAQLPIEAIRNLNLAWTRQDLGPLDELVEDIRQNGIKRPILLGADYLVFDGARRIEAAIKLQIEYVPVKICKDWRTLLSGLQANAAAGGSYPMNWLELRELWDVTFKPIHEVHRRSKAERARQHNQAKGTKSREESYNYSQYAQDLSTLYDSPVASIKILRDSMRRLERLGPQFPEIAAGLYAAMRDASPRARHVWHGRILKTMIDRIESGKFSLDGIVPDFIRCINTTTPNRPVQYGRQRRQLLDPKATKIPLPVLENLAQLVDQAANQATNMTNFYTTAKHQRAYPEVIRSLTASINRFYRLRRRLEAACITDANLEEKNQE